MSGALHLGDLIRVAGALRDSLSSQEAEWVAELLPAPATITVRASSPPVLPTAGRPLDRVALGQPLVERPMQTADVGRRPTRRPRQPGDLNRLLRAVEFFVPFAFPRLFAVAVLMTVCLGLIVVDDFVAVPRLAVAAATLILLVGVLVLLSLAARRWWRERQQRQRLSPIRKASAQRIETEQMSGTRSRLTAAEPVARPEDFRERSTRLPGPPSLVPAALVRAISTALAESYELSAVNVNDVVHHRATRRPGLPRPQGSRWTTRRGLDVHIDRSLAMEPFRGDVAGLQRALEGVVGANRVRVLGFDRHPGWVTTPLTMLDNELSPRATSEVLAPPGTPLIIVTDLGIAVPRSGPVTTVPEVWLAHHRRLVTAGLLPVYVVPYPMSRWPTGLESLAVVEWSEATRLARLRRIARQTRRRPGKLLGSAIPGARLSP
jgi:hypothetical protein